METDSTVMTSFRTRPKADVFQEVPDYEADPYAYFLDSSSQRQYQENLDARGIEYKNPLPDRGKTLEIQRFKTHWTPMSGIVKWRPNEYAPYTPQFAMSGMSLQFGTTDDSWGPFKGHQLVPATYPVDTLEAFAQKAFTRSAPRYEQFNLARFIGELREGLPRTALKSLEGMAELFHLSKRTAGSAKTFAALQDSLLLRGKKTAESLGGDTLNFMFGWAPLMSDMINICKTLVALTEQMSSAQELRPIHRTFRVPIQSSSDRQDGILNNSSFWMGTAGILSDPKLRSSGNVNNLSVSGPRVANWSIVKTYQRTQWFEGAFTRFLPLGFDGSSYLDRANLLIQSNFDAETVWKLTPWTWLTDWIVDISSTIASNQDAADKSLIAHYAYAMETTECRIDAFANLNFSSDNYQWSGFPLTYGSTTVTTWKRRIRANPFGFIPGGPSAMDPYKGTVLAALGLGGFRYRLAQTQGAG